MTEVDVVVVSYQSRGHLRACVEPLCGDASVRVLVVDNASSDGSLEAVRDLPVAAVALPENGGFARGCNAGWRTGHAPHVLFLNPDARLGIPALTRLSATLDRNPQAGAVGPKILNDDGSMHLSQRRFPRLASTYGQALFLHRLFPRAAWPTEVVRDERAYEVSTAPEWVSGACIMVRRSALEALRGFDEDFFLYCEDKDLCKRLRAVGYAVLFQPEAVCAHAGGASAPRPQLLPLLAESRMLYSRKHLGRTSAALDRAGIGLGAVTHAIASVREGIARAHLRSLARILAGAREPAVPGRPAR
jgi:N-acetylglucosaminyl-diphospho-decaprenol L-rhamnosyltransferase